MYLSSPNVGRSVLVNLEVFMMRDMFSFIDI